MNNVDMYELGSVKSGSIVLTDSYGLTLLAQSAKSISSKVILHGNPESPWMLRAEAILAENEIEYEICETASLTMSELLHCVSYENIAPFYPAKEVEAHLSPSIGGVMKTDSVTSQSKMLPDKVFQFLHGFNVHGQGMGFIVAKIKLGISASYDGKPSDVPIDSNDSFLKYLTDRAEGKDERSDIFRVVNDFVSREYEVKTRPLPDGWPTHGYWY